MAIMISFMVMVMKSIILAIFEKGESSSHVCISKAGFPFLFINFAREDLRSV